MFQWVKRLYGPDAREPLPDEDFDCLTSDIKRLFRQSGDNLTANLNLREDDVGPQFRSKEGEGQSFAPTFPRSTENLLAYTRAHFNGMTTAAAGFPHPFAHLDVRKLTRNACIPDLVRLAVCTDVEDLNNMLEGAVLRRHETLESQSLLTLSRDQGALRERQGYHRHRR